jgi:hypothetical protein
MCKEIQLIKTYMTVCQIYNSITEKESQRLSNNFRPEFTDEECITVYLWGITNRKFEAKSCYEFIKEYWKEWFPDMPSYQNFNRRINDMHCIFRQIASELITSGGLDPEIPDYLLDSMPVTVANEKRSGRAAAASEICNKGYCGSKNLYYYGVKLHALVQKQPSALPKPFAIWVTPASASDLTSAKENLDFIRDINLFADKAYADKKWEAELAAKGVSLITPTKLKKAETAGKIGNIKLKPGKNLMNSAVSAIRQPVESFFNRLQEKTHIHEASKVRSANGLLSFIFARLAACFLF